MSDTLKSSESVEVKEPAQVNDDVIFPPIPEPTDNDFHEDISMEERKYYKDKFPDLNTIKTMRLHCTACDRHLGCSARQESRLRVHPLLRTLVCPSCLSFYNSGEFDKGDDGSELYCRWCGQGGQVYCCAGCPHVFCAKCIKRNLGIQKIKEIEELDDWKCFECNSKPLWDLRAICWAVLRYCEQQNKFMQNTQDLHLKEKYKKACGQDNSECCRRRSRVKEKQEPKIKEEILLKKSSTPITPKTTPTIQVKKFASINMDDIGKERKGQKRASSPRQKAITLKNPLAIAPKSINPVNILAKRIKVCSGPNMTQIRVPVDKKPIYGNYIRPLRPKCPSTIIYNGLPSYINNSNSLNMSNDNINLSLESLTQGLDMSTVVAMTSAVQDDDVVCTPDFPMEPLCEVGEDNVDDDVQCITPAAPSTATVLPPLAPIASRLPSNLPDLTPENIIQMTENDVTVNATTGGLKFRVDPQSLSSNKMYRLPDGRIFAINSNSNMPGGYSATIVAVTDSGASGKTPTKGPTYAAKLSAATPPLMSSPPRARETRNKNTKHNSKPRHSIGPRPGGTRSSRWCDLNIPVEWYRYNLIDAMDSLEYSLSKLKKLKNEATTTYLRTRNLTEIRNLHKTLDRLLNTSSQRFSEIKESLNKDFKQFLEKKKVRVSSDDDDEVEILTNINDDDPIFIDENSLESNDGQEVDLTGLASEHDSSGKSIDKAFTPIDDESSTQVSNDVTDDINTINSESHSNGNDISNYQNRKNLKVLSNVNSVSTLEKSKDGRNQSNLDVHNVNLDEDVSSHSMEMNSDVNDKAEDVDSDKGENKHTNSKNDESLLLSQEESDPKVQDIGVEKNGEEDLINKCTDYTEEKTEDKELSEKTIAELLRDDNESTTDSIGPHSPDLLSDTKVV